MSSAAVERRRHAIVALLHTEGWLTSEQVAARFGVSPMTARRDLQQLERDGALVRRHGGAVTQALRVRRAGPLAPAAPAAEHAAAARSAASQLRAEQAIFLDDSSLARALADEIMASSLRCTVLTNAIDVMASVERPAGHASTVELIGIGGRFDRTARAFVGPRALEQVRRHLVDLAMLGDLAATDDLGAVRRAMAGQAATVLSAQALARSCS